MIKMNLIKQNMKTKLCESNLVYIFNPHHSNFIKYNDKHGGSFMCNYPTNMLYNVFKHQVKEQCFKTKEEAYESIIMLVDSQPILDIKHHFVAVYNYNRATHKISVIAFPYSQITGKFFDPIMDAKALTHLFDKYLAYHIQS